MITKIIVWTGLLMILSVLPKFPVLPLISPHLIGPLGHVFTYFVLAILILVALRKRNGKTFNGISGPVAAFVTAMAIGGSLELLQVLVATRSTDPWDLLMNAIGASVGIMVVWTILKARDAIGWLGTALGISYRSTARPSPTK